MNVLSGEECMGLSDEAREQVLRWLRLHWIDPTVTLSIEWDDRRVIADQYVRRDGRIFMDRNGVRLVRRGVRLCAPFPLRKIVLEHGQPVAGKKAPADSLARRAKIAVGKLSDAVLPAHVALASAQRPLTTE